MSQWAATLFAGCIAVLAPTAKADGGQAWADLMARMWRAFAAMTAEPTLPRSSTPGLANPGLFGRSSNRLDLPPGVMSWPGGAHWQAPFTAGPWTSAPYPGNSPTRLLDGIWETRSGAILIVRAGRARLSLTNQTSQDFDLRVDAQTIVLRDRRYGSLRRYAYATRDGRLVMQDTEGNLLLLRRVSRPGAR